MKKIVYFILCLSLSIKINAQIAATNTNGIVRQVQPRIMVVPRVNEGQDIRNILDQNEVLRATVTKMKEFFDAKGFKTISFEAQLKAALLNKVFTTESQSDMKTMILQLGDPDIYVELDVNRISCDGASIARVNMNAFYTATGLSLASKVAESACNKAEFGRLAEKAIELNAEQFLNTMNINFEELGKHGVPISIDISFSQNSNFSMSSTIKEKGGDELSDVLNDWMENAAFENQYNPPISTEKRMIVSDLRIPLKDQATGKNYNNQKFAKALQDFLKSINIPNKKDIKSGGIFITIQ
jgi:hypothetical protein